MVRTLLLVVPTPTRTDSVPGRRRSGACPEYGGAVVDARTDTLLHRRRWLRALPVVLALIAAACGGHVGRSSRSVVRSSAGVTATTAPATTTTVPTTTTTTSPRPGAPHVMVLMMENKNFSDVIGQTNQPFTNSLATHGGLATRSYAFGHPSLPNYLDLVSGSNQGVTDDDDPSSHSFPSVPTLADQLAASGYSATAYAENLHAAPTTNSGLYAVRHFPWEYFPKTKMRIAHASSLVSDLNGASPPDFVWYTPNLINDEHNGSVQQGDAFLSSFVPKVQATAWYRAGGKIIVTWDESDSDNSGINGTDGGRVPTIVVSAALAASPRQDPTPVTTAGILRSIEDAYGLPYLGGAGNAANGSIDALLNVP
jgi:hypothetical protein